jgi:hypothetical protein
MNIVWILLTGPNSISDHPARALELSKDDASLPAAPQTPHQPPMTLLSSLLRSPCCIPFPPIAAFTGIAGSFAALVRYGEVNLGPTEQFSKPSLM